MAVGLEFFTGNPEKWPFFTLSAIACTFVDQQFDGFPYGELEVFGDTVSEFVALFFE